MKEFAQERYVPILWTRRGERTALTNLAPAAKAAITPLFVAPPIEIDFDTEAPKKTVDGHLSTLPEDLVSCWGLDDAFIDLKFLDDTPMSNGQHPLAWVTERTAALGLTLLPVASHSSTADYLAAANASAARDQAGVCLRLPIVDWPSATGVTAIDDLLKTLGATASEAHLILDLAEDVGTTARIAAAGELRTLPYLQDWRSVTIAGAGIPETMPAGAALHRLPRGEWLTYQALLRLSTPLPRTPSFGDYAIASTSPGADVNPRFMNISATLRYTSGDEWLIAKGGLWKGNGGRSLGAVAVPPAARLLVGDPAFLGRKHCDFEDWLMPVAAGTGGGNPEGWRRYGTQHHLQVVTEQLASLGAPSTGP